MTVATTLAILAAVAWLSAHLFRSLAAPATFFSTVWMLPLVLLLTFGRGFFFSWRAAVVIAGVHVLFALGGVVPYLALPKLDHGPVTAPDRKALAEEAALLRVIALVFGILGLVGSLLLLATVISRYGSVAGLLANAGRLRNEFLEGTVGVPLLVRVLTLFNYPAVVVAGVLFGLDRSRFGVGLLLPLSGVLIAGLAGVARAGVLLGLSLYIPAYLVTRVGIGKSPTLKEVTKMALVVTAPVLVFFTAIQLLRLGDSVQGHVLAEALTQRYRNYSFGSLAALSTYLDSGMDGTLNWGKAGFKSIVELFAYIGFPIDTYFNRYYTFVPIAEAGYRTNIFTFIRAVIEDFGISGLMLLAFLSGTYASYLFLKIRAEMRPRWIFLLVGVYSYGTFGLVSSVAVYTNWLTAILLPTITVVLARAILHRPHQTRAGYAS
jgi:oligosaccharide repeat unit polymerase